MRVWKNQQFARFCEKENIADRALCEAVRRAERGLIDADLGGGVIKQRIARRNEGKSGGFRSIIFFRAKENAFFVYGFAKNQRDNISESNLKAFKIVAKTILSYDDEQLAGLLKAGDFKEVNCDEEI